MSDAKSDNVIPFPGRGKTRDVVKKESDPRTAKQAELQTRLARINERMSDLRETVRKQNEYLAGTGSELAGAEAVIQREEDIAKQQTSTLDAAALAAEYQRKKNAAKKYREENNRKVTREYRLSPKRPGRGDDK